MTRTYSVNLAMPVILLVLVLLAVGVIPFTPVSVAIAILLSHIELNVTWTR